MIEEALEVATDPDYRFELAIQLGRLEIAKVSPRRHNFDVRFLCVVVVRMNDIVYFQVNIHVVSCRKLPLRCKVSLNGSS